MNTVPFLTMLAAVVVMSESGNAACGDVLSAVDAFWGSGGTQSPRSEGMSRGWNWLKAQTGNTHPGAVMPFGWVSCCAFTGGYSSGYGRFGVSSSGPAREAIRENAAFGFTHFHQTGAGWCRQFYNLFLFTPSVPGADVSRASRLVCEKASPGRYSAELADYGCAFELAAAPYAACHRYRYSSGGGTLRVDTKAAGFRSDIFGGRDTYSESAKCLGIQSGDGRWRGCVRIYERPLWFDLRVLKGAVASSEVDDGVIALRFADSDAETAIGFSLTGAEEASARADEAAKAGFSQMARDAARAWTRRLSRIRARFDNGGATSLFYSALYHSLIKPVEIGDGRYIDFMTMWDMYRTTLPLTLATQPDAARRIALSRLADSEKYGFIPNWHTMKEEFSRSDEQATALGVIVLADAFFRGALTPADYPRMKAAFARELDGADLAGKSPTHTLDLSCARRAAAFVAERCGDAAYADRLKAESRAWKTVFDRSTGYLSRDGRYYEGDWRNYSFRPLPGMAERVSLAGGTVAFGRMLEEFFAVGFEPKAGDGERIARGGRFEGFNNESDIDAPYSCIWAGRAALFAEICALGRRCRFTNGEGGLPGNNDSGGLSAWYVWSCLGLHPLSGTPYYLLGSPSVDFAEIDFARGTLAIEVARESPESIYPMGYEFDGRSFSEPWLSVDEVETGGRLVFRLADRPSAARSPVPEWY